MIVDGKRTPFIRQCFVTATVGLNIICFGTVFGFPAILLPQLREEGSLIVLTTEEEAWIAAIVPLSVIAGNIFTPLVMDRLGRKKAHYGLSLLLVIGWYITIFATNFEALIISRICLGLAGGLLTTLRSVLVGESTSPRNRGAFLTTVSVTQAFGVFFVHLLGSFLSWQRTGLICVFFAFISFIMIMFTPETPSWLLIQGRYNECREVFTWLRGNGEKDELEDMIESRLAYEQATIKESNQGNWLKNLRVTICKKEFYKPVVLLIHSNLIMHLSGSSTMAAYSILILSHLMGKGANTYFWMVFLDAQRLILNILAIYLIKKIKRRTMIFSTGGLSVLSHLAIALYVYSRKYGWEYDAIWLPAMLVNLQFLAVAVGTVPMPQVIGGEIVPLEYRSVGSTIALIVGGIVMFITLLIFPNLINNIGLYGTYALFAVLILANLIVMFIWLPETKDKTLQQIEDELRGRPLKLEEIEARESLKSNPTEIYKRKLSERRVSDSTI